MNIDLKLRVEVRWRLSCFSINSQYSSYIHYLRKIQSYQEIAIFMVAFEGKLKKNSWLTDELGNRFSFQIRKWMDFNLVAKGFFVFVWIGGSSISGFLFWDEQTKNSVSFIFCESNPFSWYMESVRNRDHKSYLPSPEAKCEIITSQWFRSLGNHSLHETTLNTLLIHSNIISVEVWQPF